MCAYAEKFIRECAVEHLRVCDEDDDFDAVVTALKNFKNEPCYFFDSQPFEAFLPMPNVIYLRFKEEMDFLKQHLDGSDFFNYCKAMVDEDLSQRGKMANIPLVKNPYKPGVYTREVVVNSRFRIGFYSDDRDASPHEDDEPGEDQVYNTLILEAATISDAVALATKAAQWSNDQYVAISDTQAKYNSSVVVIRGHVGAEEIKWVKPFDESERSSARAKADKLYADASYESGWDNFSTARHQRNDAQKLLMGKVCPVWATHPEVTRLFNH